MVTDNNSAYPIWHPYTQMQTDGTPVKMVRGEGAHLFDEQGEQYIDAVASWWTNIHGHSHPAIATAIAAQAKQLEQVIFAGFTHPAAIELAEQLLRRIPFHHKVFYSDNGSTAVEAAIKMALQFWWNLGQEKRKIIAFRDAYHGDTFGAMSVSARGVFTAPYSPLLFDVVFIDTPVKGSEAAALMQLKSVLSEETKNEIAAFIFEPLVLGSAGMLMYEPEVLNEMIAIGKAHQVLTIADEVMTGFGRTGKFLATDYCAHKPDIICLSKGITGGFMPFAATTCTQAIYDAFLSNDRAKMLFHGHSYTGNPLGCAAGIAGLRLFEEENTLGNVARIEKQHAVFAEQLSGHRNIKEVRQRGTILAIELKPKGEGGYLSSVRNTAYHFFMDRKIILRPLGNVLYVLPPYCITTHDLELVHTAIRDFVESV